jgi:hypothetical protein
MLGSKISDLTVEEFRSPVREIVRQTLTKMLNDPHEGLVLEDGLEDELRRSIRVVNEVAPTHKAEEAVGKLGIEWRYIESSLRQPRVYKTK